MSRSKEQSSSTEQQPSVFQKEIDALYAKVREYEILLGEREAQIRSQQAQLDSERKKFQDQMVSEQVKLQLSVDQHQHKITFEREALKQEKEHFQEAQTRGIEISGAQEPVTVEVGGEKFRTELRTLAKCKESLFPSLVKSLHGHRRDEEGKGRRDPNIFIDRDGRHFRFILNYLRQGKNVMKSSAMKNVDEYTLEEILAEVRYYKIPELESLVLVKKTSLKRVENFDSIKGNNVFREVRIPSITKIKYSTTQQTTIAERNLTNITFDGVLFKDPVTFENCVMVSARFIKCTFKSVVIFSGVDLRRAKFEHCDGVNLDQGFSFYNTEYSPQDFQVVPPRS